MSTVILTIYHLCTDLYHYNPVLGVSFSLFLLLTAVAVIAGVCAFFYVFYRTFISGKSISEAERISGLRLERIIQYVLSLVFFGFALMIFSNLREAVDSKNWPVVMGTVNRVWLEEAPGTGDPEFYIRINYNYTVNGQSFYSDRIDVPNNTLYNREKAESVMNEYPVGSAVVYYNPSHPEKAVLKPGNTQIFWLIFTLIFSYLIWPGPKRLFGVLKNLINAFTETKPQHNLRAFFKSEDALAKKNER